MKVFNLVLFIALMIAVTMPGICGWSLKFGEEKAQVGFKAPVGPEDFPIGPNSYRVFAGKLWVADSAKGRIISYSSPDKAEAVITIPDLGGQKVIEDFALQTKGDKVVAIWLAERFSHELIKMSPDGKVLVRFKASGLAQLDQLAVDSTGRLYVGDYGKSLIAAYSDSEKSIFTMPWDLSGFAVDADDNLHVITYDQAEGHRHKVLNPQGKAKKTTQIGIKDMQNPRLWKVTSAGDIFVSFIPALGNPTGNILVKISAKGIILKKTDFTNPYYIGRYLLADDSQCWLVKADYLQAPAGSIEVRPLGFE
jgi:hypothetical protein